MGSARVLVIGGLGMLGHVVVRRLHTAGYRVTTTVRSASLPERLRQEYPEVELRAGVDLRRPDSLLELIARGNWDVVVNAAGIIKHRLGDIAPAEMIAVNAVLPWQVAEACSSGGARLIQISSDCVFSGRNDSARGPLGYREQDRPDAVDQYGLSKLLGEPAAAGALCLRTSLIGRELRGHHGLVDWYLRNPQEAVRGYTRALFSGLTSACAADLIQFVIEHCPGLDGLWHVSADAISKYELLEMLRQRFPEAPKVNPDGEVFCDRRLDSNPFRKQTGWRPPAWDDLVMTL